MAVKPVKRQRAGFKRRAERIIKRKYIIITGADSDQYGPRAVLLVIMNMPMVGNEVSINTFACCDQEGTSHCLLVQRLTK